MISEKLEKKVGNIFAWFLVTVVILCILTTVFRLLFRDGHGVPAYGNRGDAIMYDDY